MTGRPRRSTLFPYTTLFRSEQRLPRDRDLEGRGDAVARRSNADRKSTRLNSSHLVISYAVFCLKKKTAWRSNISLPSTVFDDPEKTTNDIVNLLTRVIEHIR